MYQIPHIKGIPSNTNTGITISPTDPKLHNLIEYQCRTEYRGLREAYKIAAASAPMGNSRSFPYDQIIKTKQGRTHFMFLTEYFMGSAMTGIYQHLDVAELNRMSSRLLTQDYETKGRRKLATTVGGATEYREFRNWWICKHLAHSLNYPFDTPCPLPSPEENAKLMSMNNEQDYLQIGHNFEKWTGHSLPTHAWDWLRKEAAEEEELRAKVDKKNALQLTLLQQHVG